MKSALTIWLLLVGLLMQSVTWALPAQQNERIDRLAHEMAHGLDHGHHGHDAAGHEVDPSLDQALAHDRDDGSHGSHHSHAGDNIQVPGLPWVHVARMNHLSKVPPGMHAQQPPRTVHLDGLLRPPRTRG